MDSGNHGGTPPKPATLAEAHAALLAMLSADDIEKLRTGGVDDLWQYHHGLGMFIRNEWLRHGTLGRVFAGERLSLDAMSGLILESFVHHLHGQPFDLAERIAEQAVAEREHYASMTPPEAVSPADGSPIKWVIVCGSGAGAVHTGYSLSDGSCWRWVYAGSGEVEPATPEEEALSRRALGPRTWKDLNR